MSARLSRRGPDGHSALRFDYTADQSGDMSTTAPFASEKRPFIELHGYLLAMRGLLPQPLVSRNPSGVVDRAIVWNGESFRAPFIPSIECLGVTNESSIGDESDTLQVFDLLSRSSVMDGLSQIEGPWATVYYSKVDHRIYFGRDPRGRRSLMVGKVGSDYLLISSIPWRSNGLLIDWIEVDTKGIYNVDLKSSIIALEPWKAEISDLAQRSVIVPPDGVSGLSDEFILKELMAVLRLSVRRRVHFRGDHKRLTISATSSSAGDGDMTVSSLDTVSAPVAVLFSGGLDSTVLAALVDKELPLKLPIDLINVAFGSESQTSSAPDRITCLQSYEDLCVASPRRAWRMILVNISKDELEQCTPEVAALMYPNNTLMDISISAPLWFASRAVGVSTVNASDRFILKAHGHIVSQKRASPPATTDNKDVDIHTEQETGYQEEEEEKELVPFTSRAKVLLVGAGADEQFAGYGRHRVSYRKGGWEGLQQELDKDIKRLWKRNLGRDDRVLSDHGKEARFPFLDADVMHWISSRYLSELCDMELPPGEGDKRALRLVAHQLGLKAASVLPKRAIQFGTKITKQMPKGKGTDNFEA